MNLLKEIIANLILFAWAIFFTWHFIMIQIHGQILITETNPWILWFEIVSAPLIAFLAIERLIKDIKGGDLNANSRR